jgi:hypothetical protein
MVASDVCDVFDSIGQVFLASLPKPLVLKFQNQPFPSQPQCLIS